MTSKEPKSKSSAHLFKFNEKEFELLKRPLKYGDIPMLLFYRPLSIILARFFIRLHCTPNLISLSTLIPLALVFYFMQSGNTKLFIWGGIFIQITFLFDVLDGTIARLTDTPTAYGAWLDTVIDVLRHLVYWISFIMGAYKQSGDIKCVYLLVVLLCIKIFVEAVKMSSKICFKEDNEEFTYIKSDESRNIVKLFPFLSKVPSGLLKNPLGSSLFPILLTIGAFTNHLIAPLLIYSFIHLIFCCKTIIRNTIKYI